MSRFNGGADGPRIAAIAVALEVPIRLAPAASIRSADSGERTPPDVFY